MSKNTTVEFNPFGCLPIVVSILILWGLCCGVTLGGKHYDMSCSCDKGVDVTAKEAKR